MIKNCEIERVVVLNKDRLLRFGFEIVENICKRYVTIIEVIDKTERAEEQELVEALAQIISILRCRSQGKRTNKAKKITKELLEEDKNT